MRSFRIIVWLLFLWAYGQSPVFAQTKRQYLKAAEEASAKMDHYSALVYFRTVADAWPEDIDVAYRAAEAAGKYNSFDLAEKYYDRVLRQDKQLKYPEAAYHLAGVKRSLGKYREAINLYSKYDDVRVDKSANCQMEIAACEFAIQAMENRSPIEFVPHPANTPFSEFAPFVLGDTLFYTSLNFPAKDEQSGDSIYVSRLYRGPVSVAGQVMTQPSAEGSLHIAHTALDNERGRMYFSI
jgi:tetratricopeptide (TPR) repeat protein